MPRSRTTRATERIRSGGFRGGTFQQEAAPERSQLHELAAALGGANQALTRGATTYIAGKQQQTRDASDQLRQDAIGNADVAKAAMSAMSRDQRDNYVVTDDMQAKLNANPFLLPMLNKFEGSKVAQELWQSATEEINILDDEAWSSFLEENATDKMGNKSFAAGYNAEMLRVENQRTQQTTVWSTCWLQTKLITSRLSGVPAPYPTKPASLPSSKLLQVRASVPSLSVTLSCFQRLR